MKTPTGKGSQSIDTGWVLLGEYSFRDLYLEFRQSENPAAGFMTPIVRLLSLPDQCMEKIEGILRNLYRDILARIIKENADLNGRLRIFCQKKIFDDKVKGGWGYFMVEWYRDASLSDRVEPLFDYYIYEEGE